MHGEALIDPDFSDLGTTIEDNQKLCEQYGAPFSSIRHRARTEMLESAIRYTSAYRDVDWVGSVDDLVRSRPILMAGHQPAIFHPGVWFKNFALSHLGRAHRGIAVNLVIDNDVAAGCSIRVPVRDAATGRVYGQAIPYDSAGGGIPYEETVIRDRDSFDSFDQRVRDAIAPMVGNPCVDELWKHARAAIARCGVAGCALAQARHALEGQLGLKTLELPLGVACRTSAFAEFTLAILSELPRFHQCYNSAADHYRAAHGIRSSAHPVPNLGIDDDWFEAPMWIYGANDPQRKSAWVRMSGKQLVISDRGSRELKIDMSFPKLAAEQLANQTSPDFKLRPRALLTTMYARLVLSDLFLHGIGGGKYDQLNDRIIESFFMVTPPEFLVMSATVQLPNVEVLEYDAKIRELKRSIRDTIYQGERFADRTNLDSDALALKAELLSAVPERGQRVQWHQQLEAVNEVISNQLADVREGFQAELVRSQQHLTSQSLLASREHPFCLFPLDYLQHTFDSLIG